MANELSELFRLKNFCRFFRQKFSKKQHNIFIYDLPGYCGEVFFDQKVLSAKNTIQKSMLHTNDITFYGKKTARKWRKNDHVFADNTIYERRKSDE